MTRSAIGFAEGANRGEVALRVRAAVAHDQPDDRLPVPFLWEERGRRRQAHAHGRGQLARRRLGQVAVGREHVVDPVGAPYDEAARDGRADLVQAVRESGDDAEVAPTAPQRPEEVGVLVAAGRPDLAVRGDDLDLLQVVHRPAEATREVTQAAAERQAGDADSRVERAQRRGQSVRLRRSVDVPEQTPRADVREPRLRVDADVAHARHVERQTALGDRGSGHVVAAALDAQQQTVVTCEPDGRSDVGGRVRLEDECGGFGDHAVPDQHRVVPAHVARTKYRAPDPRGELVELLRPQRHEPAVESGDVDGARLHAPSVHLSTLASRRCLFSGHSVSIVGRLHATPLPAPPLAGFGQLSGSPAGLAEKRWYGRLRGDDERHRRGLRALLPAERQP